MTRELFRNHPRWTAAIAVSVGAALVARVLGASASLVLWVASPALVLSGWAALGHLITIDDEYPGGFSNPDRDPAIWRESLHFLLTKLAVFVAVVLTVLFLAFAHEWVAG